MWAPYTRVWKPISLKKIVSPSQRSHQLPVTLQLKVRIMILTQIHIPQTHCNQMLTGLALCMSCVGNSSCYESMTIIVQSWQAVTISFQSYQTSDTYNLSHSFNSDPWALKVENTIHLFVADLSKDTYPLYNCEFLYLLTSIAQRNCSNEVGELHEPMSIQIETEKAVRYYASKLLRIHL